MECDEDQKGDRGLLEVERIGLGGFLKAMSKENLG